MITSILKQHGISVTELSNGIILADNLDGTYSFVYPTISAPNTIALRGQGGTPDMTTKFVEGIAAVTITV